MTLNRKENVTIWKCLLSIAVCLGGCFNLLTACAQDTSALKQKRSPEQTDSIWKSQVSTVARVLNLPADKSEQLTKVYLEARKARREAMDETPKGEEGTGEKKALSSKLDGEARDKLRAALAEILSKEQLEQAMLSLGSSNPRWDRYVGQILEFHLDNGQEKEAEKFAYEYIVEYGKARAAADAANDRLSSVVARDLKAQLDSGLAKLLSKEQLAEWNKTTAFRAGGSTRSAPGEGKRSGKQGGRKSDTSS